MAIGVKYGTNEPSAEKRIQAYQIAEELYRTFEKQNGTVMCRELIGFDLSDEKQRGQAVEEDVFEMKCSLLLAKVVKSLELLCDVSV